MRGIAISRLLMVAVLVPLAGMAMFGGRLAYDSWWRYSDLSHASAVVRLAAATARFVGIASPGEGGINRDLINGNADRGKLAGIRRVTDEHYRDLQDAGATLTVKVSAA